MSAILLALVANAAFALTPIQLDNPCPEEGGTIKVSSGTLGGGLKDFGDCTVGGIDPHLGGEDPAGTTGDDPPMLIVNFAKTGNTSIYLIDTIAGETLVYSEVISDLGSLMNVEELDQVALLDLDADGLMDLLVGDPTGLNRLDGALWAFEDIRGGSRAARDYDRGISGPYAGFELGLSMDLVVSRKGDWTLYIGGASASLAVSMTARSYVAGLEAFTSRDVIEYRW